MKILKTSVWVSIKSKILKSKELKKPIAHLKYIDYYIKTEIKLGLQYNFFQVNLLYNCL